jgi:hypothetical protein
MFDGVGAREEVVHAWRVGVVAVEKLPETIQPVVAGVIERSVWKVELNLIAAVEGVDETRRALRSGECPDIDAAVLLERLKLADVPFEVVMA